MCLGDFSTIWFMKLQTKLKQCPHFVKPKSYVLLLQNWSFSRDTGI